MGPTSLKYWNPLYFFVRQHGLGAQHAEDATQEFLMRLIEGELLSSTDPALGRFRSYLLTAWKRFLIDRHRSENRIRLGGPIQRIAIHSDCGEERMPNVFFLKKPPPKMRSLEAELRQSLMRTEAAFVPTTLHRGETQCTIV